MNQDIQEIALDEIELVNGSAGDFATPTSAEVVYPQVENNPPG